MSFEYGQGWRIKIGDGATPTEVFTQIGGEVAFDWEQSSKDIDLSSKDDGYLAAAGFGSQSITFPINGKLNLPDTAFAALVTASKAQPPVVNIKVMKGATTKYAGQVSVGNLATTFPNDEVCTWKATLKASAVPTTNSLTA